MASGPNGGNAGQRMPAPHPVWHHVLPTFGQDPVLVRPALWNMNVKGTGDISKGIWLLPVERDLHPSSEGLGQALTHPPAPSVSPGHPRGPVREGDTTRSLSDS